MNLAIQTEHLGHAYGSTTVLRDLNLSVPEGEIYGFLGHNGAGKTTTLSILSTLLQPSAGKAWVLGKDVRRKSVEIRRRIGYVPENVRLYDDMTAAENLTYLARLSGIRQPAGEIRATLGFLHCTELADRPVKTLSKGQRQRIGLAQAIVHRPKLIFLDEPTSGLDPEGMRTLRELILALNRERGTTLFINTHQISEVSKTCSAIAVINHGSLVFQGSLARLSQQTAQEQDLEDIYFHLMQQTEPEHA